MADAQIGNPIGGGVLTDPRSVAGSRTSAISNAFFASTKDVTSLRAALTTANGAYYTSTRLNEMSRNDMEFALKGIL